MSPCEISKRIKRIYRLLTRRDWPYGFGRERSLFYTFEEGVIHVFDNTIVDRREVLLLGG